MKNRIISLLAIYLLLFTNAAAQETEVKLSLNEQFFETLLEAVFDNLDEPKVPLSLGASALRPQALGFGTQSLALSTQQAVCDETVRLKKEIDGVQTAVRFRNGKILAPIAFEGNYSPPLIGCIGFSGWAETTIDLSFDENKNALIGNAKVLNVNLSGTNGIGSSLITRLVQNSLDKKINPLEIVKLDMLSFTAPIQNSGKLRMEAVGIRHVVGNREIDVYLKYRFKKAQGS